MLKIPETCCSGYSETRTTRIGTLKIKRGDNEALLIGCNRHRRKVEFSICSNTNTCKVRVENKEIKQFQSNPLLARDI